MHFCLNEIRTLVAMATKRTLPLTCNEKAEIGIYLTEDILTKVLQKCSLSSPLPTI